MNRVYLNNLYDIYKNLLSDKEQNIFENYYMEDLSLSEIAENESVTRNAIHKSLKTVEEKLNSYENKLNFYQKKEDIYKSIDENNINKIKDILERWF